MIPDYRDIADYIHRNYKNKVIEVGVGSLPHVALELKDKMDVIITDINEPEHEGLRFSLDDIFTPDMSIYTGATLIYSIRPPMDIQGAIARVAKEAGSDLIIRPFGNEKAELDGFFDSCKVVNHKKARFFLYK
ncbi:MAG: UPF0146 family protein [Candidatus Methanoperedens sp.]|nr:UPF0146 family protein [Candidatus Methanoperedens sp.]